MLGAMMISSIRHDEKSCRKRLGEGNLGKSGKMMRAVSSMVAGVLAGFAVSGLGFAAFQAGDAAAQSIGYGVTSNNPNVFVNNDLLNSLGPGGPAGALPYYGGTPFPGGTPYAGGTPYFGGTPYAGQAIAGPQGTFVLTRPGTLLFPPAAYPRSHLVNRNVAVTLNQPSGAGQAAEVPRLTAPEPQSREPSVPQVAARTADAAPPPPAPKQPKGQSGLAPPPPVPAKSKSTASASAAPPPPKAAASAEAVPLPPAPSSDEETVAGTAAEPQLTPPPPPAPISEPLAESGSDAAEPVTTAAVPPPPTSVQAEEPKAAASQEAARPPASEDPVDGELRLLFTAGKADLSQEVKSALQTLAKTLVADGNARVQLLAYATSSEDSPSRARRLSLSRALAVRAFLIDQGVRSTRMDVRALGDKAESDPKDRVDIQPARR